MIRFCFLLLLLTAAGCHPAPTGHSALPPEMVQADHELQADSNAAGTYLADSLIITTAATDVHTRRHTGYWLAGCLLVASSAAVCLFLYKRRNYRRTLQALEQETDRLHRTLHAETESAHEERQRLFAAAIERSDARQALLHLLKQHKGGLHTEELVSPELWVQLTDDLELYGNGFCSRLRNAHPRLKEQDIRFCCLLKAGFKYADVACLLGRTPNMMYKRRDGIIGRMEVQMTPIEFDAYLRRF